MVDFVKTNYEMFQTIIIVIDECDQGDIQGSKSRLEFIKSIEDASPGSLIKVIFVTATIANFSKNICKVAVSELEKFDTGVVNEIINNAVVEHYYVTPHESYVPPSYFLNTKDVWIRVSFSKTESTPSERTDKVFNCINALPDAAKELCLICLSNRKDDHSKIAKRLYNCGFNVTDAWIQNNRNSMKSKPFILRGRHQYPEVEP